MPTTDTPLAWTACHLAPETVDATPYDTSTVTATTTHYVETPGKNVVKIRLKRDDGAAITTDVVILAYGKDIKGDFRRLEIRPMELHKYRETMYESCLKPRKLQAF